MECSIPGSPSDKARLILRIATGGAGLALLIMGILALLSSIATLALSSAIVSFYTVIGGVLCCLAEAQFAWFLSRATLFQSRVFRGAFYMFVGSLSFAVFSIESILGILIMITGGVLMVAGAGQILFAFFGPSDGEMAYGSAGGQSGSSGRDRTFGAELGEGTFNPDDYSTPAYAEDPKGEVAGAYDTYEDSLSPMQYAQAAAAGNNSGNAGSAYGSSNYSAYESY